MAPVPVLISGRGVAGSALAYWSVHAGHRPIPAKRTQGLRVGGRAVAHRMAQAADLGAALRLWENDFRPNEP
jgi:hypothetical protein